MDQILSFIEAHTADICLLLLGVLTSICNFIIMFFRTKTSRLEKIVDSCLRPHLDDPNALKHYYIKIDNHYYCLADLSIEKREESSGITLAERKATLDASASKR